MPEVTSVCRAFSSASTGPHTPPVPHRSGTRCTLTEDNGEEDGGGDGVVGGDDGDDDGVADEDAAADGDTPRTIVVYSTECLSYVKEILERRPG